MKRSFFTLALALPLALLAQTPKEFTISGHLKNTQAEWVYLVYANNGAEVWDSTKVNGDAYTLKGTIDEPTAATLLTRKPSREVRLTRKEIAQIYLAQESFSITHVDSFSNTAFEGSKINQDYKELQVASEAYSDRERAFSQQYMEARNGGDAAKMKTVEASLDSLEREKAEKVYAAFVKAHANSPLAVQALQLYYSVYVEDMKKVETLYGQLGPEARNTKLGKDFSKKFEIAASTAVGKKAFDFTQEDTLGHPVSLSSFKGKYVLVDFWASWCGPCRMANPGLVKVYNDYKSKTFTILGVSLDQEGQKDKWLAAIHKDNLAWTQVSDLKGWQNAAAKQYGIEAIPQNILVDPSGVIIAKNLDEETLRSRLHSLFP